MKRTPITLLILGLVGIVAWQVVGRESSERTVQASTQAIPDNVAKATFAGGCFWCMEPPFEKLDGVFDAVSGYTGGHVENPTYEQVCSHTTGHVEAVQIQYDPEKISYNDLLEVFWRQINPTDAGGQFVDRGSPYHSACLLYTSPSPRDATLSRMPSSA